MKQLGKNILIKLLCIIPFTSISCQGFAHETDTLQIDTIPANQTQSKTALTIYADSVLDVAFQTDTMLRKAFLPKKEQVQSVCTEPVSIALPQHDILLEDTLQPSSKQTMFSYADSILNVSLQSDMLSAKKVQPSTASVTLQQLESTPVTFVQSDTIPEKKALGRFYRGVKNLLFVKKKSWMTGLTISQGRYDSEDTEVLSLLKDFDCKVSYFSINPFLGYFIRDNIAMGLKFGYQKVYANLANFNIEISDDMSLSLKDMSFNQNMFNTTLFHRSYVGIDKGKRFGLFNEVSLSYSFGSSNYQRGSGENLRNTKTDIHEIRIGLNPGATVFIMENVSAELSFGVAGLNYRRQRQTTNGVDSGWRNSSGANFKINLLNINIGIVAYL